MKAQPSPQDAETTAEGISSGPKKKCAVKNAGYPLLNYQ